MALGTRLPRRLPVIWRSQRDRRKYWKRPYLFILDLRRVTHRSEIFCWWKYVKLMTNLQRSMFDLEVNITCQQQSFECFPLVDTAHPRTLPFGWPRWCAVITGNLIRDLPRTHRISTPYVRVNTVIGHPRQTFQLFQYDREAPDSRHLLPPSRQVNWSPDIR